MKRWIFGVLIAILTATSARAGTFSPDQLRAAGLPRYCAPDGPGTIQTHPDRTGQVHLPPYFPYCTTLPGAPNSRQPTSAPSRQLPAPTRSSAPQVESSPSGKALLSPGGILSGYVKDAVTGAGINGVVVYVHDTTTGNQAASSQTDSLGNYSFSSLQSGNYTIEFDAINTHTYMSQWYSNKSDQTNADTVSLTSAPLSLNDVLLVKGGSITGKVVDSITLAGVSAVRIDAYDDATGRMAGFYFTDSTGEYSMGGLPTGKYRIYYYSFDSSYVDQWYNGKTDWFGADLVEVTAPNTTAIANVLFVKGASITGTIKDATTLAPLNSAVVELYEVVSNNFLQRKSLSGTSTFTFSGIKSGSYKLKHSSNGYIPQWYQNKPDQASATAITTTAPNTTNLQDIFLTKGGTISGTVRDAATQQVLQGVAVSIYDAQTFTNVTSTTTSSTGTFAVNALPSGSYKINFDGQTTGNLTRWYPNAISYETAAPVAVTAPDTVTGVDIALGPGGSISGRVTDYSGVGIPGISVSNYSGGYATTDSSGNYSIRGLDTGSYRVTFYDQIGYHTSQWYDGKSDYFQANQVQVIAPAATNGIDAVLLVGGGITGTATNSSGVPLSGIDVFLTDMRGQSIAWNTTDSAGRYVFGKIPSGSYKVLFEDVFHGEIMSTFYGGNHIVTGATPVAVLAPNQRTGIDVVLEKGGTLSGTITDTTGVPISGVDVTVFDDAGYPISFATTGSDGSYQARGIPIGVFRVAFTVGALYAATWNDGAGSFTTATSITVTSVTDTTGVNAQMGTGPGIFTHYPAIHFGNVALSSTTDYQGITVSNYGTSDLSVGTLSITGSGADQFSLREDSCSNLTLPPGYTCSFFLFFTPTSIGPKTASVAVPSNDPDTPVLEILAKGTGVTALPGYITASTTSLNFGNATVGNSSPQQTVSLMNEGPGDLTISGRTLAGAAASYTLPTAATNPCPSFPHTFSPGTGCSLAATFAPAAGGPQAATLGIASDAANNPAMNISLWGNGQYSLTVDIFGEGIVSNSLPASPPFSCAAAPCTASFDPGTAFVLRATPSAAALFDRWTGNCSGTGDCSLTLTSNMAVAANFTTLPPVRIGGTVLSYFQSLADAYASAADDSTVDLDARAVEFVENLYLGRSITVRFNGGFNSSYSAASGTTKLNGNLRIMNGRLAVGNLAIR